MSLKRIRKELEEIQTDTPFNCSAGPVDDNLYKWEATLIGPEGTPYEGGTFHLKIPPKYTQNRAQHDAVRHPLNSPYPFRLPKNGPVNMRCEPLPLPNALY